MPRKYREWSVSRLESALATETSKPYEAWPCHCLDTASSTNGKVYYRLRERRADGKPGSMIRTLTSKEFKELKQLYKTSKTIHMLQSELQRRKATPKQKNSQSQEAPGKWPDVA